MRDQIKLPRRAMLPAALLGSAGIAGLLVGEAKADTLFTSFAFNDSVPLPSTPVGVTKTARTDPDRWADVINVKSFGALGDGVNDDTNAIQAAMNAAFTNGTASSATLEGNVVFFPPGRYIVKASLNDAICGNRTTGFKSEITLQGSGANCTTLDGVGPTGTGISGWVVDKSPDPALTSTIQTIRDIGVINRSLTAGTGAVRLDYTVRALVLNCELSGQIGLDMSTDTFGNNVINCHFSGRGTPYAAGSIGIAMQQGNIIGGKMGNWENAIRLGGGDDAYPSNVYTGTASSGCVIHGIAIEVCGTAIVVGKDLFGNTTAASGAHISAIQTEQCLNGINVNSASACFIGGLFISGIQWVDATPLLTGLVVISATACVFGPMSISALVNNARVDLSGSNCKNCIFQSVYTGNGAPGVTLPGGGVFWKMPATGFAHNPYEYTFIGCDNPVQIFPFLNLRNQRDGLAALNNAPGATEGDEFNISNLSSPIATPAFGQLAVSLTGVTWTTLGATKPVPLGYQVFDNVNTHIFMCTTAGTTGSSEPTWVTTTAGTSTTTDGSVTWTYINLKSAYGFTGIHARVRFNGSAWTVTGI